jgi:hypothetical protein
MYLFSTWEMGESGELCWEAVAEAEAEAEEAEEVRRWQMQVPEEAVEVAEAREVKASL